MIFEKYPLWELNINSKAGLMVEANVHEQIFFFPSAQTPWELWNKPVVQREDLSKELSFCSLMLAKTIWNYLSFQTAKKKMWKNVGWDVQKCLQNKHNFSEILDTSSLTEPKTGIFGPSSENKGKSRNISL